MPDTRSLKQFRFRLEWAGSWMGFTEVTGLDVQTAVSKPGSAAATTVGDRKIAGLDKASTVTLKRGVVQRDTGLKDWLSSVRNATAVRADATLLLFDEAGTIVKAWSITRAFVKEVVGPSLKATGNEVAIEVIEFIHDGMRALSTVEAFHRLIASDGHKSGVRALLFGPAGSGKAAAVAVAAKDSPVVRVSVAGIIEKYIGETEKNIEFVFERAERAGALLFFDEADALFGKRTEIKDAHDKYANQEVSYILQRLERCRGIVVFSSNSTPASDSPLLHHMDLVIQFPLTLAEQRA